MGFDQIFHWLFHIAANWRFVSQALRLVLVMLRGESSAGGSMMAKLRAQVRDIVADGDRRKAGPLPAFDHSSPRPRYDPRRHDATQAQIEAALQIAAKLVVKDPVYIPIFQRLMAERDLAEADRTAIGQAMALVALQDAMP